MMLTPKGFKPIAVRDDRGGTCVVSYNPDTKEYFLAVGGKGAGPFTLNELKQLTANVTDVIDLRGVYIYIETYGVDGTFLDDNH